VLRYVIGSYTTLRGVLYLFEGILLLTGAAQYSLPALVVASLLLLGALFFVFAGCGIAMGNFWTLKVGAAVLVVDVVRMAGALVLWTAPADLAWLLASLFTLVLLVFKDPIGSNEERGLDEDESVHGLTSFQN
jgi:hypothetical protein